MARSGLFFRTRSPTRDKDTDARRQAAVRESIEAALQEAEGELAGVDRRVADARLRSVTLMDESGEYDERAPEDEQDIVEFERQAQQAGQRAEALRRQIETYRKLLTIASSEL